MNPPAKRKRIGGIQKGYVYPKTLAFKETLNEKGFHIPEKLIALFEKCPDTEPGRYMQLEILKEMNKYSYPVPRDYSVPTDSPRDVNTPITVNDVLDMIEDEK